MHFPHLFLAGTFDGLHAGHRAILARAFSEGEKVTIGLTSDEFIRKFKIQKTIKSYKERKHNLEAWLREQGYFNRAKVIAISDPYEPAASMPDLDSLIVTQETRTRGEQINALRQGLALSLLALIEVLMVAAEDGKPVSSTRLRSGEIDAAGRLIMPESLRTVLAKPLGKILTGRDIALSIHRNKDMVVITVGDIATKTLLDEGISPTLAIIDGMVGRKPFHETVDRLQPENGRAFKANPVKSGPGYISREAVETIRECLSHSLIHPSTHHALVIDGEEDLLVLPAITHAPLEAVLYYGQPGQGLVEVVVTKKKKEEALEILEKFT